MSHEKVTLDHTGVLQIASHAKEAIDPLLNSGSVVIAALMLTIILSSVLNVVLWKALSKASQYSQTRDIQVLETLSGIRSSIEAVLKSRPGP